jgi:hypothetical protein
MGEPVPFEPLTEEEAAAEFEIHLQTLADVWDLADCTEHALVSLEEVFASHAGRACLEKIGVERARVYAAGLVAALWARGFVDLFASDCQERFVSVTHAGRRAVVGMESKCDGSEMEM